MRTTLAMTVHMVKELGQIWWVKLLLSILLWLVGRDPIAHRMYYALLTLMAIDLATGVWKASKQGDRSSRIGVAATVAKFGVYLAVVAAAQLLEVIVTAALGISPSGTVSVKLAVLYLAVQEAISIDENLRAVYGVGLGIILKNLRRIAGNGQ